MIHTLECGCTWDDEGISWVSCKRHGASTLHRVRQAHAEVIVESEGCEVCGSERVPAGQPCPTCGEVLGV